MDQVENAMGDLKIDLPAPAPFSMYALPESAIDPEATPKTFGAKSANIVHSRRTLPEWIHTPRSAVIPFGVFEEVMAHPANADVAGRHSEYKCIYIYIYIYVYTQIYIHICIKICVKYVPRYYQIKSLESYTYT